MSKKNHDTITGTGKPVPPPLCQTEAETAEVRPGMTSATPEPEEQDEQESD